MLRRSASPRCVWPKATAICILALATVVPVAGSESTAPSISASTSSGAASGSERLAKIKDDLDSKRCAEVRAALLKGLGPEALTLCREVLASDPVNKTAAQLAQQSQNAISVAAAHPPSQAKLAAMPAARQAMAERLDKVRKDALAQYLALAQWCEENSLPAEKTRCYSAVVALDPTNKQAHLGVGDEFVPAFGWVKEEIRKKWADGLWYTDGRWLKWEDVSRSRIDAMKARESAKLGEGFRYIATHHLTVASNLKDVEFEKDLVQGLEVCIADQRVRLFEPFELGKDKPFYVIAFQACSEFREYCSKINSSSGGSMGFYDPDRRTLHVWRVDGDITNGIGTSFHELTHGTVEDYFGTANLPSWLDEGVASFHEKARQKGGQMNLGPINVPRMGLLRQLLAAGKTVRLQDLIVFEGTTWQNNEMLNYNASAMLMHFLWERGALQVFLRSYKTSRDAKAALEVALKQGFAITDREYQAFLREKLLDPEALKKMESQMAGTRKT